MRHRKLRAGGRSRTRMCPNPASFAAFGIGMFVGGVPSGHTGPVFRRSALGPNPDDADAGAEASKSSGVQIVMSAHG